MTTFNVNDGKQVCSEDRRSGHPKVFSHGLRERSRYERRTISGLLRLLSAIAFVLLFLPGAVAAQGQSTGGTMSNKQIIQEAFDKWANGTGSFFDLLTDDMVWTITGSSPISKTYTSRQQFLDEAITPLNDRLSVKIIPKVRGLYAEDDMVIALWDGTATAKDGKPYNNTYSWFMTMKNGRIVKVVAFFDTIDLADVWKRIPVTSKTTD